MRTKQSYQECGLKGAKARWSKEKSWQERFWDHVEVKSPKECWPWKIGTTAMGYGKIKAMGKTLSAHRTAFELSGGSIPKNGVIRHQCNNKRCCNPAHLLCGTTMDNVKDIFRSGKIAKLTEENVRDIRRRTGQSQASMAREFGVHVSTIHDVIKRVHWAHVV